MKGWAILELERPPTVRGLGKSKSVQKFAVIKNGHVEATFRRWESANAYVWHMNKTKVNER